MRKVLIAIVMLLITVPIASLAQTRGTNIKRGETPTPEVHSTVPAKVENGKVAEIVVKGVNFAPNPALRVNGDCKLLKATMASPNEAHFTITSVSPEGGECNLEIGGGRPAWAYVQMLATAEVMARRKVQEEENKKKQAEKEKQEVAAAQENMKFLQQKAPELVGKKWTVKLPNGKAETWTFTKPAFGGGEFKSLAGEKVTIMMQPGEKLLVMVGQGCVFGGSLKNGKVTDGIAELPESVCKHGAGKWTATVE